MSNKTNIRTNIIIPEKMLFWLKKVALAKGTSVSKELRDMIIYCKKISYWGGLEINKRGLSNFKRRTDDK